MHFLRSIIALAILCLASSQAVLAQQQPEWEIESLEETGGVIYDLTTGIATATNGVLVKYGGAILKADQVIVNQQSGDVIADGQVRIQRDDQIWASEHLNYNFQTRQMQAMQFRTGKAPFFAGGKGLGTDPKNREVYTATNAIITTDDLAEPQIKIRAKSIRIIPGDRIIAKGAVLYLDTVPVFWFPYYSQSLNERGSNFDFLPGYRGRFGPYLLSSYTWKINKELEAVAHVDYRVKRGFGVGPDLNYDYGAWGTGKAKYYYLHDQDPNHDNDTGVNYPENRQRVWFSYEANPVTNLVMKSLIRYQGDPDVVQEFFQREYRLDPQPNSYVDVNKLWSNFSLDLYAQPRLNDFLETVEKLPELKLTGYRQQVANTPLFYESESSAGYYRRLFPETNGIPYGLNYEASRVDTFHQVLLPETYFGFLNVTPNAGGRFSYYSEASGPGATTAETTRGVFNTGVDTSLKASRIWPQVHNGTLELDGLRHILVPSVKYTYIPNPTAAGTNEIPQFDYQLSSIRVLPTDFPDYNSVDSINSQNTIRFGINNKLQTRRRNEVVNFFDWNLFIDWNLTPRPDQVSFSDLSSDFRLRPRSWLTLESSTRYNIQDGQFRLAYNSFTIHPGDTWSWTFGYFYMVDDYRPPPYGWGVGNNVFRNLVALRVNQNWGLRAAHHFNADTGRMEEQAYSIYRDLRSWTAALSFRLQNNQGGQDDFTVAFTFSLKAYPTYGLGDDSSNPYSLLGD
jgi:lipopolysaccharide assembly outer membrane protein LptD (OstA)